jgi:hypothetical protein
MFRRARIIRWGPASMLASGMILSVMVAGWLVRRFAGTDAGGTAPLSRRKALTAPTRASLRHTKEAVRRTRAAAARDRRTISDRFGRRQGPGRGGRSGGPRRG